MPHSHPLHEPNPPRPPIEDLVAEARVFTCDELALRETSHGKERCATHCRVTSRKVPGRTIAPPGQKVCELKQVVRDCYRVPRSRIENWAADHLDAVIQAAHGAGKPPGVSLAVGVDEGHVLPVGPTHTHVARRPRQ